MGGAQPRARPALRLDARLALDGACSAFLSSAPARARPVQELTALAARCGARELAVRAALHRVALGDGSAGRVAQVLVADIDNPALIEQAAARPARRRAMP